MNINDIFSTSQRIKILEKIVYSEEIIGVNKTAKELKLTKGLVSKYFSLLVSERILKRYKNKFLVLDNLFVKSVRIMLNINMFNFNLFKKYPFVESVGMYGSCANGTNKEDSDIDLWISIKKTEEVTLSKLTNELKRKNEKINILFLTQEKIVKLKKEDALFYHSLFFGSIILYGDGIEV